MADRGLGNPLGNPLVVAIKGGLKTINPTIVDFVNGASGDFVLPDGYSFFRVTAVGAGGAGSVSVNNSGGGGGLARTGVLPAIRGLVISYSTAPTWVDSSGTDTGGGGQSSASFGTVSLVATGGRNNGTPGSGTGGDFNFSGGSGVGLAGGGAAGPNSNGGDGAANGNNPGSSSADGGGGGSGSNGTSRGAAGGGGVMSRGGAIYSGSLVVAGGSTKEYWGTAGLPAIANGAGAGGDWGGGGGYRAVGSSGGTRSTGGYGGVRIELW